MTNIAPRFGSHFRVTLKDPALLEQPASPFSGQPSNLIQNRELCETVGRAVSDAQQGGGVMSGMNFMPPIECRTKGFAALAGNFRSEMICEDTFDTLVEQNIQTFLEAQKAENPSLQVSVEKVPDSPVSGQEQIFELQKKAEAGFKAENGLQGAIDQAKKSFGLTGPEILALVQNLLR